MFTVVVLESRQRAADPDKEQALRGNSEYLGKDWFDTPRPCRERPRRRRSAAF
jgi:hypothetical protein